jgi:hypothetical protein
VRAAPQVAYQQVLVHKNVALRVHCGTSFYRGMCWGSTIR